MTDGSTNSEDELKGNVFDIEPSIEKELEEEMASEEWAEDQIPSSLSSSGSETPIASTSSIESDELEVSSSSDTEESSDWESLSDSSDELCSDAEEDKVADGATKEWTKPLRVHKIKEHLGPLITAQEVAEDVNGVTETKAEPHVEEAATEIEVTSEEFSIVKEIKLEAAPGAKPEATPEAKTEVARPTSPTPPGFYMSPEDIHEYTKETIY